MQSIFLYFAAAGRFLRSLRNNLQLCATSKRILLLIFNTLLYHTVPALDYESTMFVLAWELEEIIQGYCS